MKKSPDKAKAATKSEQEQSTEGKKPHTFGEVMARLVRVKPENKAKNAANARK